MMKRIIATLIIILLAMIIFIGSPFGLQSALYFAKRIPGLELNQVSGSLLHQISIGRISYHSDNERIKIQHAQLQWHPLSLVVGNIKIKKLLAQNIELHILKQPQKAKKRKTQFKLAMGIEINTLKIKHFTLKTSKLKKPISIERIVANAFINEDHLDSQIQSQIISPRKIQLQAHIRGNLSNYKAKLYAKGKGLLVNLNGNGDSQHINIKLNNEKIENGSVTGFIHMRWLPQTKIKSQLHISKLPIQQQHINGHINIDYQDLNQFTINSQLKSELGMLSINGAHKKQWHIKWNLHIHDLSDYVSQYKGFIQSQGYISGDTNDPHIKGNIQANNIQVNELSLKQLQGQFDAALDAKYHGKIAIALKHLQWQQHHIHTLNLTLNGNTKKHNLQLELSNKLMSLNVKSQGQFQNKAWHNRIEHFNLNTLNYNNWKLKKPVTLTWSKNNGAINAFCLNNKKNTICLSANKEKQNWQAKLSALLHLANFKSATINNASIKGTGHLQLNVNGTKSTINSASVSTHINNGEISIQNKKPFILNQAKLSANYKEQKLNQTLALEINHNGKLVLNTKANNIEFNANTNPNITSTFLMDFKSLDPFNAFLPTLFQLKGAAHANINVNGTLKKPGINGHINFKPSELKLTELGLNIDNVTLKLKTTRHALHYHLSLETNYKPIALDGQTNIDNLNFASSAKIQGQDLAVMNTVDYQILASPDLTLHYNHHTLNIEGHIGVPKAHITPQDFTSTKVIPRSDIVFVRDENKKQNAFHLRAHVMVSLGKDIYINTHGVSGKAEGKITLIQKPDQPLVADGRIMLNDGRYNAHGQKLTIERGSFNYVDSPIANPNINITAIRHFNNYSSSTFGSLGEGSLVVGLNITGNFSRPKIHFFSRPATLSQTDILSYLLLGHGASGGSSANAALLLQALNTIGSSSFGGISEKLQKGLGLSEFGVESAANLDAAGNPINSQNAFVVGKYITPKIYLRYSMGLSDSISTILLRYYINRKWSVQTENSTLGNGGDILYSFSRQ